MEKYHIWIKCFLLEFIKKWPKIDFLRLDKYIMMTRTVLEKYFDFNLKHNSYKDCLKIFDYIVLSVNSGFYNFNFLCQILNVINYMIEEFFKNENFRKSSNDEFFRSFTDKIIFVFLTLRDKRNINNFKENVFSRIDTIMIKDPFFQKSNLKTIYQKMIFEKATSKEEIPEPQRSLLFKVYKKLKYNNENYEIEEKEQIKNYEVDAVNDYILKKSYSNRTRLSKIEKIKLLSEKRKHMQNNQKQLKQMEEDRLKKIKEEIEDANFSTDDDVKSKKKNKLFDKDEENNELALNSDNLIKKNEKNKEKRKSSSDSNDNKKNATVNPNNKILIERDVDMDIKNIPAEEILEENIVKLSDEENDNDNDVDKKPLNRNGDKKNLKNSKKYELDSLSESSLEEESPKKLKNKQKENKEKKKQIDLEEELDELEEVSDEEMEEGEEYDYEEEELIDNLEEDEDEDEENEHQYKFNNKNGKFLTNKKNLIKAKLAQGDEEAEMEEIEDDLDEDLDYEELEGEEFDEFEDYEDELDYLDEDEEGEEIYDCFNGINSIYDKIRDNGPSTTKPPIPKTKEDIEMQKNIHLARNNSIKNAMIKSSSPNILLGKKRNKGLLGSDDKNKNNQNINMNKNTNNNKNQKKKKVNFSFSTNTINSK